MPGIPYTTEFTTRFYETDSRGLVQPASLVNFFEETALRQSESAGVGLDYYRKHQVVWLLHSFDISIARMPAYGDRLIITTTPESICKFYGYRSFELGIKDSRGKAREVIKAMSSWIFVDTRTKRPLRVNEDMKHAYGYAGLKEEKMDAGNIPAPGNTTAEKTFSVRHSDIDMNRHVNNVVYINWAMEGVQELLQGPLTLKRLQVAWLRETLPGSGIVLRTERRQTSDGILCLQGVYDSEGEEKCRIATTWQSQG